MQAESMTPGQQRAVFRFFATDSPRRLLMRDLSADDASASGINPEAQDVGSEDVQLPFPDFDIRISTLPSSRLEEPPLHPFRENCERLGEVTFHQPHLARFETRHRIQFAAIHPADRIVRDSFRR
jgi:hypothetical protein